MEAAYGLTITIDMIMTSALLLLFFKKRNWPVFLLIILGIIFSR
jgi:K+ transporter